jgi:hypothetical protein
MEDTREQFNVTFTLSGELSDREVGNLIDGLIDLDPAVAHDGEIVVTTRAENHTEALIKAAIKVKKYMGDVVVAQIVTTQEFDAKNGITDE